MSSHDAWNAVNATETLDSLRAEYPRYTDNELYAIWCRDKGLIPIDDAGRVILEQWQLHAVSDGEHVQDGGFKVSRPLFGRARKASSGVPKPAGKPRGPRATVDASGESQNGSWHPEAEPPAGQVLSDRAILVARRFDRAAAALDALRPLYRELLGYREVLAEAGPAMLLEIAALDDEAAAIVDDLILGGTEDWDEAGQDED